MTCGAKPEPNSRAGDERAERRARGHADHDDREQAVARFLAVDVVGERPELRDQRDVEDADPDEERDADVGTPAATASANSSMQTMKNSVTPTSSFTRSTREANQL